MTRILGGIRGELEGKVVAAATTYPPKSHLTHQECVSFSSFSLGNYLVALQDFSLFGSVDSYLINQQFIVTPLQG